MKNRIHNLTPDEFYAIERRARADRAREMARIIVLLVDRIVALFRVHTPQGGRKAAGHA